MFLWKKSGTKTELKIIEKSVKDKVWKTFRKKLPAWKQNIYILKKKKAASDFCTVVEFTDN